MIILQAVRKSVSCKKHDAKTSLSINKYQNFTGQQEPGLQVEQQFKFKYPLSILNIQIQK